MFSQSSQEISPDPASAATFRCWIMSWADVEYRGLTRNTVVIVIDRSMRHVYHVY